MAGREAIDIEGLVYRAYAEKRIDRLGDVRAAALGLMGPRTGGSSYSTDDKVDTSSFSARAAAEVREMQLRLANAPRGLLDLHDVVLGLDDFFLERGAGLDWNLWDAQTAEAMGHELAPGKRGERAMIRKTRARGGRGPGRLDRLPEGEWRPLDTIKTTNLVILHGRHGDRPYLPDVIVSGKKPTYKGADKLAAGHVPVYETPLHAIVEARASYAAWHTGLTILAELFASSPEFEISGPSAPARPWELHRTVLQGVPVTDLHDEPAAVKTKSKRAKKPKKTEACDTPEAA